ncbi:hypothetical protein K474DRAFT_1677201 [Panus rudis PR-1116 ss-1]|nr:hypothetical protein K474DRAFT_1677201 [Panus rudis PR-1116 ss-1]
MDMPDLESISSSVSDPLQEVLEILEAYNDHAMVPTPIPPSIDTWSNGGVYAASPDPYHSMTLPSNSLGLYEAFNATATSNVAYPPSRQNADACLPQEHAPALTYDTRPTPAIHSEQYPSMNSLQIPQGVDYNDPPSFLDAFTQPSSSGTSSSSSGYLF